MYIPPPRKRKLVIYMPQVIIAAPAPVRVRVRLADSSNYARTQREPSIIVLHSTEGREGDGATDDNVAAGISKPNAGKSFHYVVDADSITRCVPDLYVAWHARKTANARGLGVEICGSASQTYAQWLDATSLRTLQLAARLVSDLCIEYKIPPVLVTPERLRAGDRGITTHYMCSLAWKESTHTDPGPGFPLLDFIESVAYEVARPPAV